MDIPAKLGKRIQAVIRNPVDLINLNKRDKVFMKQVEQGKILWEREINDDNVKDCLERRRIIHFPEAII